MNPLKDFLLRYARITPPDGALKGAIAAAIKQTLGVDVPQNVITVTRESAYLSVDSSLKAAIFMKQDAVLHDVAARVGEGRIKTLH